MNISHINIILRTCLKSDRPFRQRIISRRFLFGCSIAPARGLNSSREPQGNKDGMTVLPSPQEVTIILRKNEFNKEFTTGSIKSYDSNQLASNDPIEDTRSEAQCRMTQGLLMGIFDGHGGPSCAQVISKRLLHYVAAALLPSDLLKKVIDEHPQESLLETFNDRICGIFGNRAIPEIQDGYASLTYPYNRAYISETTEVEIVQDLKLTYENSFKQYLEELWKVPQDNVDVKTALEKAIMKLDSDLSREVVESYKANGKINSKTLSVALSGAVTCVSHVSGPHLHVANVGDCCAVVGTVADDEWRAIKITKEHNSENFDELKRIWNEHPHTERKTVIRRDRLLGELAPLRSLGDYRYKWPVETLSELAVPIYGQKAIPANYHTPPYLTAQPEIYYHRLTPKDKFLIIASDGLWDMMTPLQAVKLVGEHMKGKVFFNPLKLPRKNIQLGDINELLLHRKESLKSKPKDRNAATHLIRHAIGGTEYGVEHSRLAQLLSLAPGVSRMFRDDITVTVVYFDSEFLRQCPA